jgi:membrane protease YdiL (CAAX protease family)
MAIPLLVAILVFGVLAIAALAEVYTFGGPSGDYGDVMHDLPVEVLIRQAWLPQLTVGLVFLALTLRLGWVSRARLRLPSTVAGWAVGLLPCAALLAVIDYGYLQDKGSSTLPVVFLTFLTVGFTEELGFRGVGIGGFQQAFTLRRSWLYASGLFGAAHFVNILQGEPVGVAIGQVVMTTLMGLLFGALAIKSGSLILAMVAHGLWDVFAVTRLMRAEATGALVGNGMATLAIAALVAVALALAVRSSARQRVTGY